MKIQTYRLLCYIPNLLIGVYLAGMLFLIPWRASVGNSDLYTQCREDSDCVLIARAWCKTIISVNKKSEKEYLAIDKIYAKRSADLKQTCKVGTEESLQKNAYIPACVKETCTAKPKSR